MIWTTYTISSFAIAPLSVFAIDLVRLVFGVGGWSQGWKRFLMTAHADVW